MSGPGRRPGIVNSVLIAGAVYNTGGQVQVLGTGSILHITGKDASGYSYWQQNGANAQLYVQGGNINASGTYQIDTGTVQFMAVSGAATDELDGAGLIFGNANATALTILDSTQGFPGTVTIQGPVTLGANTTTTENFVGGGNNNADRLDVQNGKLTLNGTLNLVSSSGQKPVQPLSLFDDAGGAPAIGVDFTTITVNIQGVQTQSSVVLRGGTLYYTVSIT